MSSRKKRPMSHKKMRFTQITMQTPARKAAAAARKEKEEDVRLVAGS
jgi:hypothetical protein